MVFLDKNLVNPLFSGLTFVKKTYHLLISGLPQLLFPHIRLAFARVAWR